MNESIKNKNYSIDNLRALAILLVVIGHSIILYSHDWNLYSTIHDVIFLDKFKSIINLIQMPLFFSISGYLYVYTNSHTNFKKMCKKKFKRLLIPYTMISLFWMIPIKKMLGYSGFDNKSLIDIFFNENGHLWFLPCLFLIFCLSYIVLHLFSYLKLNERKSCITLVILSWICSYFFYLIPPFFGSEIIRSVSINWIWFCIGYAIHIYKGCIGKLRSTKFKWLIVLLFVLITFCFTFIIKNNKIGSLFILLTLYIFIPMKTCNVAQFLSKNSFGIYLFHSPLIYITFSLIPNVNPLIVVFVNFVLFGLIAILMTCLLRKFKLGFVIGEG